MGDTGIEIAKTWDDGRISAEQARMAMESMEPNDAKWIAGDVVDAWNPWNPWSSGWSQLTTLVDNESRGCFSALRLPLLFIKVLGPVIFLSPTGVIFITVDEDDIVLPYYLTYISVAAANFSPTGVIFITVDEDDEQRQEAPDLGDPLIAIGPVCPTRSMTDLYRIGVCKCEGNCTRQPHLISRMIGDACVKSGGAGCTLWSHHAGVAGFILSHLSQ